MLITSNSVDSLYELSIRLHSLNYAASTSYPSGKLAVLP